MTSPTSMPTNPFDPVAVTLSIAANLATDIIKHYTPQLEGTLAGQALKRVGLITPNFKDRLQESLKQALLRYFTKYPEYALWGVESLFRDPIIAQQLMGYIVDHMPISHTAIQEAVHQHLSSYAPSRVLFEQRGLNPNRIFPDFLECYEQVLREQLSVPEIALLFEIWKLTGTLEGTLRTGQAQTQEQLDQFLQRLEARLSPEALRAAYQAGQQELAKDLVDEIDTAGLAKPDEAVRTIEARFQPLPALFADGLCRGQSLRVAAEYYFVSHGFDPAILADWRETLSAALAHASGAAEPLKPYFAGDTLLDGFRLCGICEKLCATRFSVFLLPPSEDRNVYLELGIAIGLKAPFFLIQHHEVAIPSVLESLGRYMKGGMFRTMRRELPGQIQEYDFGVVRVAADMPSSGSKPTYLVAPGGLIEDEDFEASVTEAIESTYPHLEPVALDDQSGSAAAVGWALEQLIEAVQTSRFGIYRVDEACSPTTFLALGISIGLNRPFLMIHRGRKVPQDIQGVGMHQYPNYATLRKDLVPRHQTFFEKHAR